MRCLKITLLRLVFLKEFSKADHWPGCFCPQVFHNTIFYWISVFVHHTKSRTASSFSIYDLEFSFSWSHSIGFKYGTKLLPPSLFTLLASQRCGMIWKEFKIYIYKIPSFWMEMPGKPSTDKQLRALHHQKELQAGQFE